MSPFVFMTGTTSIPRRVSPGRSKSTRRWPASISRKRRFVRLHPRSTNRSRCLGRSSFIAIISGSGESPESSHLQQVPQKLVEYQCASTAKESWSTPALIIVSTGATYYFCRPSSGSVPAGRTVPSRCWKFLSRKFPEAMKRLIVFDLDGTLAESKASIDEEMAELLNTLLGILKVSVISGGAWSQFEKQVLAHLSHDERLKNLSLLPTCGTKFYRYDSKWELLYSEDFTADEKTKIIHSIQQVTGAPDLKASRTWGELIQDRGSQITFSGLGQQAPLEEKKIWDPDFAKRKKIKALLDKLIPEFSVRLGGATSVDVTKHGIDKAYGIRKLRDVLSIPISEMIFIGDAVFPGGNDYPAKEAGALSIRVRDPHETKRVIEAIVACLEED